MGDTSVPMRTNESDSLKSGRSADREATIAISGDEGREIVETSHHIIPENKSVVHVYKQSRSDGISETIPLTNIDTIARSDEERSRVRSRASDDTHDRDDEDDVADEVTDQDCRDARDVRYEYTIETVRGTEYAFHNDEMQGSRVLGILHSMDDLADEILTTDDPIVERNSRREYVRLGEQLPAGAGGDPVRESDDPSDDGELVTDGGEDIDVDADDFAGVDIDGASDDDNTHDRVENEEDDGHLSARDINSPFDELIAEAINKHDDQSDAKSWLGDEMFNKGTNSMARANAAEVLRDNFPEDDESDDNPVVPDDDGGDGDRFDSFIEAASDDETHDRDEEGEDDIDAEEIRARGELKGDSDDEDDPSDEDGYIRNSDEIRVAVGRTLDSRLAHNKEGKWMCTICEAVVTSAHGAKTHFGRSHPDADADDVANSINRRGEESDGVDFNITEEDIAAAGESDDGGDDGDVVNDTEDGGYTSWDAARDDYAEARLQSSPITRADARDSVVDALQEETRWIAIRERSEPGKHYELHRWDEDDGWQDDAKTYISERTAEELGSKATDTEDAHYRSQLARRNYISQDVVAAADRDDTLIPVANGTINIDEIDFKGTDDAGRVHIDPDSVVLEDMDPENYFLDRVQTDWDPENADIEGLKSWMREIIHTENERAVVYELAGHALHHGYPTDAFGICVGAGGSGKSQMLEVIKHMIGKDNVGVRTLQQIENADFSAGNPVPEQRMNINTELSGEQLKDINTLKAYSSGDETEIEPKGKPAYDGYNHATMMFASDSPPRFPRDQDDDALGRRFHPIEFPAKYVDDPNPNDPLQLQSRGKTVIEEELRAEDRLKAMLYVALDGLARMLHEGGITDTRSRTERINQYESFSDPVHDFARNALIAVEDDDHGIKAQHLKTVFDSFAEAHGHAGKQLSDLYDFISEMPEYPVVKDRSRDNPFSAERPTRYLGVGFSERALNAWVPETMMRYYGDNDDEEVGGPARETLKEIIDDDSLGRREGVKVEVSNSTDKTSYNRHEEGVLQDESGTIRYYIQAPGIHLEEGETYVIRDVPATVGENGETMLQLIPGMSDVTRIERGTDEGQDDLDDDDDDGDDVVNESDESDTHDRAEQDMEALDTAIIDAADGEKSPAVIAGEVTSKISTEELYVVQSRIKKLKERGDIITDGRPEPGYRNTNDDSDDNTNDDSDDNTNDDSDDNTNDDDDDTHDRVNGDPEPPEGRMHDADVQCRECGAYWPVMAKNGHFEGYRTECKSCGEPVDAAWNIAERTLDPEHLPDELDVGGEEA